MDIALGVLLGAVVWFFARHGIGGLHTVGLNQPAVPCTFGRAQRPGDETTPLVRQQQSVR